LSSYEDYTRKSANYDKIREPVGTEILVGCFAHAPVPLDRTVVLDAGCGTGSYSDALLRYVGPSQWRTRPVAGLLPHTAISRASRTGSAPRRETSADQPIALRESTRRGHPRCPDARSTNARGLGT
jgi:hypothetical protein